MHRLHAVRARVPGGGDLRRGRRARRAEGIHAHERRALEDLEADHRAQAGAAGCGPLGQGERKKIAVGKIKRRSKIEGTFCAERRSTAAIFALAKNAVVVMTTTISKYYFSERFFRKSYF